ncbi:membrane protein [Klebsiella aerogenes]|nr:membrane protein [Klebsiella aerogenes]KZR17681.1 hypothetical protein A3N65_00570 [Klebsiella aerogenes]
MRHVKLIPNVFIGILCFIVSFFIVLFPLGGLLDYLSRTSNDFLNSTGLGFADGDADPSFLWVLLTLMMIVTVALMLAIQKIRSRKAESRR